jgi:hypothetical protein
VPLNSLANLYYFKFTVISSRNNCFPDNFRPTVLPKSNSSLSVLPQTLLHGKLILSDQFFQDGIEYIFPCDHFPANYSPADHLPENTSSRKYISPRHIFPSYVFPKRHIPTIIFFRVTFPRFTFLRFSFTRFAFLRISFSSSIVIEIR